MLLHRFCDNSAQRAEFFEPVVNEAVDDMGRGASQIRCESLLRPFFRGPFPSWQDDSAVAA
jgi:hypothetical protein